MGALLQVCTGSACSELWHKPGLHTHFLAGICLNCLFMSTAQGPPLSKHAGNAQASDCPSSDMQPAISLGAATGPGSYITACTITGPCTRGIHISSSAPVLLSQNTVWNLHGHGIALLPPSSSAAQGPQRGQMVGHAVVGNLVGGCRVTGLGLPSEAQPAAVAIGLPGCTVRSACLRMAGRAVHGWRGSPPLCETQSAHQHGGLHQSGRACLDTLPLLP